MEIVSDERRYPGPKFRIHMFTALTFSNVIVYYYISMRGED